jgi:hypothetical protein
MREFKFLRHNTWYNPNQQLSFVTSGTNTVTIYNNNDVTNATINTFDTMSELIEASRELRESIRNLEAEAVNLRDTLNAHIYGSDLN